MKRTGTQNVVKLLLGGLIACILVLGALPLGQANASSLLVDCYDINKKPIPCTPRPPKKPTNEPARREPTRTPKPTVLGKTSTPIPTSTFTLSATPTILIPTLPGRRILATSRPLGDIWVVGIEVTQAIQVYPGNPLPLIGYKPTVVRVYVRSSGSGWTNVTARLTVTGNGVTGRVLLPRTVSTSNTITVSPRGSNRNVLVDSFNFLLDSDLTAAGVRDLQVHIYSLSGRAESNTENNYASLSIRFNGVIYARIYGVAYGNDGSDPAAPRLPIPPWTDFEIHRRYSENVMPVTQFYINPFPGTGREGRFFRNLQAARDWAALMMNRAEYITSRIYLLQPDDNSLSGYASGGGGWMNGQNNRGNPGFGIVMAQEVSHSFGGWWHADSAAHPVDALADPAFPYPHSSVGVQVGFNTIIFQPVPPTSASGHTHDYMGYGDPPAWTSPYTYCRMIDEFAAGRFACPASARTAKNGSLHLVSMYTNSSGLSLAPHLKETKYIYVAGWLNPDGTANFDPFFQQESPKDLSSPLEGDRYQLQFRDSTGNKLATHLFEPQLSHSDPDHPLLFSLTVPYPADTAQVLLLEGDRILAERLVSSHSPEVSVSSLGLGEVHGLQTVSWQGSDADSDPLTYLIEYSADNGQHWIPLDVNLTGNSDEIDFDSLPGGNQARLRVVASDGVNTTEAYVENTFSVPAHSPEITLLEPLDGASFYQTQPFYVTAQGFDWEDGPIEDMGSYVWSSDVDGKLSTGSWTALAELSPGEHTLSVQVSDSAGNVSSASVHITILNADGSIPSSAATNIDWAFWVLPIAGSVLILLGLLVVLRRQRR